MSQTSRIAIVAALIAVVAAVIVLKNKNQPAQTPTQAPNSAKPIPRLVDLGAGKCIPCKMMAPILEELKREMAGKFQVDFIDVWENPDAAEPYGIKLIPTQIFYDAAGKELYRHEGFFAKADILAKWQELGVDVGDFSRNVARPATRPAD